MNNNTSIQRLVTIIALIAVLLAGFLCTPRSANAQWQLVNTATGEDIEAIASEASGHIYAGADMGVYVSSNNGENWNLAATGLTNPEVLSLAVTPAGTVLAGTEGGGIFRSTNFGNSWDSSSTGLPDSSYIISLASDGHGNLYAGQSMKGVFYSSDDGLHWSARNSGMDSAIIFSLTVAPSGVVYAGGGPYVFSSSDSGQHWDTSFIAGPPFEEVLALAADSAGDVFAGTFLGNRFRLLAGNNIWEDISPRVISSNGAIHTLVTSGNSIFAGLFGGGVLESSDSGSTWNDFSGGLTDPKIYAMTATPSGFLFAGTFVGDVFRTSATLAVEKDNTTDGFFEVWPQPLQSNVNVSFSLEKTETAQLRIFDALGREIEATPVRTMQSGKHNLNLDLSTLPNGSYVFILQTPSGTRSLRANYLH